MNKLFYILSVCAISILTIGLRLYKIDAPIADWHSWRQVDTASVARNYVKLGIDPLRPRYDDLSSIPSGLDNPEGFRMVEFPLYQIVASVLAKSFPTQSVEFWLRLVTIVAAAGTAILLTFTVTRITGKLAGIITGIVYAILPFSVYYGRAILPETFAVFWAVLSLYLLSCLNKANRGSWGVLIFGAISGAIALLVKPTTGFLLIPSVYLVWRKFTFSRFFIIGVLGYWIIGVLPLVWWRKWILQFPEGIPAYTWLLNSNGIRFKGAWFHWLFAERLGNLILGYWGLIPFGFGILTKPTSEERWLYRWLGFGTLMYLIVFATGNVQHDYYQILLLPVVSIYLGKGIAFLLTNKIFSRVNSYLLLVVSCLCMLAFSWYTLRTFYWINRPDIVEAGRLADQFIPKDAKVIAPYNGDTTFLYQTNRQGWPIGFDIEKKLKMGATHYVTVSPTDNDTETKQLVDCYTVLIRNDRYAIIDLTKPTKNCTITNP